MIFLANGRTLSELELWVLYVCICVFVYVCMSVCVYSQASVGQVSRPESK